MRLKRFSRGGLAAAVALLALCGMAQAEPATKLRIDYATYNPVSLVLKEQGFVEKEFAKDGVSVEWVKSAGSNTALDALSKNTVDFGSCENFNRVRRIAADKRCPPRQLLL